MGNMCSVEISLLTIIINDYFKILSSCKLLCKRN